MGALTTEIAALRSYLRASRELSDWIRGAHAIALLCAALESGLLETLRSPHTVEEAARASGLDEILVRDLGLALEAHGVLIADRDRYVLAPTYALLADPAAAIPLAKVIRHAQVVGRTIESATMPAEFTNLDEDDVVAMAEGSGVSSMSASRHVAPAVYSVVMPEVDAAMRAGAHHLEVGCGVGNALLGVASYYPDVTAVGIEIDESTAAEADRRAQALGLADRIEVRVADASEMVDRTAYDTVQWSQFFFPTMSRVAVMRAILAAMKPGAYLFAPWPTAATDGVLPPRRQGLAMVLQALRARSAVALVLLNDVIADTSRRRQAERRLAGLQRLLFDRWGVPLRTPDELAVELEGAGFDVIRSIPMPASQFAYTRGFLLARRPLAS